MRARQRYVEQKGLGIRDWGLGTGDWGKSEIRSSLAPGCRPPRAWKRLRRVMGASSRTDTTAETVAYKRASPLKRPEARIRSAKRLRFGLPPTAARQRLRRSAFQGLSLAPLGRKEACGFAAGWTGGVARCAPHSLNAPAIGMHTFGVLNTCGEYTVARAHNARGEHHDSRARRGRATQGDRRRRTLTFVHHVWITPVLKSCE